MEMISIIVCVVLLPLIYSLGILFYRSEFIKEENKKRCPLSGKEEWIMLLAAEAGIIRMWFSLGKCTLGNLSFELLFLALASMTILCMTDLWEQIVPNKILIITLMLYIIIIALHIMNDMPAFIKIAPDIILGFIFCIVTFGLAFLFSKGSMGAGDVKQAILLGLMLTGNYVVKTIMYGCIVAMVYSAVGMLRKKLTKKDALPFIPFLYIGLIITYVIG